MNKILILIITFLNLNVAFPQIQKMSQVSDEEIAETELRRKIGAKKITFKYFKDSLSFSNNENFKIEYIKEFDENGDEVKVYSNLRDSLVYLSAIYEYDNQHRRISFQEFYEDGTKGSYYQAMFNDSIIICERRTVNYMSHDSSYYSYNMNGNRIFEINYKNGVVKDSTAYLDDTNGKPMLSQSFTSGRLNYFIEYEYLTDNDYIERIFERDSTLRLKRYWKHDKNNNILERVEFDKNEEISTWYSYTYDCDGNETSAGVYKKPEKKLSYRSESVYEDGKLLKKFHYNKENKLSNSSHYLYDDKGMNTVMISKQYKNDIPKIEFIYKMEIEYEK